MSSATSFNCRRTNAPNAAAIPPWEPGQPLLKEHVIWAYRFLHADSTFAIELLDGFLRGGHQIETGDVGNDLDLDVALHDLNTDVDNIWTIQIEEDQNPVFAANLLFEGLKQASVNKEVYDHYVFEDPIDDILAFKTAMNAAVQQTRETAIAATELYLSGLGVVNEGLDWIIVVNDVSEGHYESLAAALPFISAGLVKSGGHLIFRKVTGEVLDTLDTAGVATLKDVAITKKLATIGTVFDDEGYRAFLLQHNGPSLEPTSFRSNEGEELSSIEGYFYGLFDAEEYNREGVYTGNRDELPNGCLAIVCDGCGNEVCIGLAGDERGKIYFYNHEADGHETAVGEMGLIANSFDEFLEGLYEYQDEETEESKASPPLFGVFVNACRYEGNKPSALLEGQKLDAYLMKGRNKDMSKIPGDTAMQLLDSIMAGAKEIGTVTPDFVHGSVRDSIEYFLPGNHQISIGITDREHLICEGKYWQTSREAWGLISRLLDSVGRI